MALDLNTKDFDDLLINQYGVSSSDFMKRIQEVDDQNHRQIKRWQDYLASAREELCLDDDIEPIKIIQQIKKICEYEQILNLRQKSLCQQLKHWKTSDRAVAAMIDKLQVVKQIPKDGLDNIQLEGVLEVFQNTFGGVQLYRPQTRDFMYCDVQKRFNDQSYPSDEQMLNIEKLLPQVEADGLFRENQSGMLEGSEFGKLTAYSLMDMYTRGFDLLGIILNTCACNQGGQHWVAVVISHTDRTVEIFDSTGQYRQELKPAIAFCKNLAETCSQVFHAKYTFKDMFEEVQKDTNTCGVFALFYIYARILGVSPDDVFQKLKENKDSNTHIKLFKKVVFGA